MAKNKKDRAEFSADDIGKFLEWLAKEPEGMQAAVMQDRRLALRILRNIKDGRQPGSGGGTMTPLYGAPFS